MKKVSLFAAFYFIALFLSAQVGDRISEKQAVKWFNKNQWRKGFTLTAHPSIDKVEFAYQYHSYPALWNKAFAYLQTHDLSTIEKGDYPVAGDSVIVKVSYGPPKEDTVAKWESHKKYIDLQTVGASKEKMGVAKLADASVTTPYDPKTDNANYQAQGKYYIAEPGTFFIFFPGDVHRPGIKVDTLNVRKIVVKILKAQ